MRLKHYINEEYDGRIKSGSKSFEVFVNPSFKEMKEIDENVGIRFIANAKRKKVWVVNGWDLVHVDMWNNISNIKKGFTGKYIDIPLEELLPGECRQQGGKYVMTWSDRMDRYDRKSLITLKYLDILLKNYKWLNRYIDINYYLKGDR
jgi:hypothetical protein